MPINAAHTEFKTLEQPVHTTAHPEPNTLDKTIKNAYTEPETLDTKIKTSHKVPKTLEKLSQTAHAEPQTLEKPMGTVHTEPETLAKATKLHMRSLRKETNKYTDNRHTCT